MPEQPQHHAPHRQIGMCPYCGEDVVIVNSLTTTHPISNIETRPTCEGSGQHPRCAESDARPLWNGTSNGRFRG